MNTLLGTAIKELTTFIQIKDVHVYYKLEISSIEFIDDIIC